MNTTYIMINWTKENKSFTNNYNELNKVLKDYEKFKEWSQSILIMEVDKNDVKIIKNWSDK